MLYVHVCAVVKYVQQGVKLASLGIVRTNTVRYSSGLCRYVIVHSSRYINRCRFQRCVRYGTYRGVPPVYTPGITGAGPFGNFGTARIPVLPVPVQTFIPVPEISVSSIQHQTPGKFGTASIPITDIS